MAEDDSQEKSQEPTAKRLEKARDEGQVPRSKELATSAILIGATAALYFFGSYLSVRINGIFIRGFTFGRESSFDTNYMFVALSSAVKEGLFSLIPIFIILLIIAFAAPLGLGGWLFSSKSLMPKGSRMNPLSGLKRMFSVKALVELVKSLGKVGLVVAIAIIVLYQRRNDIVHLSDLPFNVAIHDSIFILIISALLLSCSTLIIAAIDIPFQLWENNKNLKMSMQEVRDEMKDSEGRPEVKGRIRRLQRDLANNRMMQEVPTADVILTNPTHFSVALKYDPATMKTPLVVAKGGDFIALKIREIANAHSVEILQAPALTRAIFYTTEVDKEIPAGLYLAVAQVLAYIFQLRQYRRGKAKRPKAPKKYPIPKEYTFDK
ncbi:flagellar biosynthesis protein FlhB [Sessilibacter sp. MAH1]